MGLLKGSFLLLGFTVLFLVSAAEVLVQLNVNRPFNDVNEKFVSFSIKPEDLYNGLDGSNRDMVTHMAALLGTSYIKLLGSYNFDKQNEVSKRNPTRVIWKGFNRWSRTVNWTMIVPIDYTPEEWEPMDTLKALNNSYMSGIHDCIYQFGTNSSVLNSKSYLEDFRTFDLMLEAFRPNVHRWLAMGADVSPGISADEINRFVETTRDYNVAFGWKQNSDEKVMDTSLRTMIAKKVPVWLSLPQQKRTKRIKASTASRNSDDELSEGMRYAQVLGDAASSGFDTVFKYISATDLEKPTFSTYVSAFFKKVMGSRVFPSKLLHLFKQDQKLYTHCANGISGGMAFMAINKEERPLHITINSLTKLKPTEVLQYSINMKKGQVFLNGAKIYMNSTLTPYVRTKPTTTAIKLVAPPSSVNYWVLPSVDLEHCQFLEMAEDELEDSAEDQKIVKKRHSAAEKLISQLIRETKIPKESFSRKLERSRRAINPKINNKNRISRSYNDDNIINNLFGNNWLSPEAIGVFRQELKRRGRNAIDWIQTILDIVRTYDLDERNVRRSPRALHDMSNVRKPTHDITRRRYKNKHVYKSDNIDEEALLKKVEELLKKEYHNRSEERTSSSEEETDESSETFRKNELKRWLDVTSKDSTAQKYRKKNEAQEMSKYLEELFKFNQNIKSKPRAPKKIKIKENYSNIERPNEDLKKIQKEIYKALWNYRSEEDSGETHKPYEAYEERPVKKISWWDEDDDEHKKRARRSAKLLSTHEDSRENRVNSHEIYFPRQPMEKTKQTISQKTDKNDKKKSEVNNILKHTETLAPYNFLDTVTNRIVKLIDVMTKQVNNFQVKLQPHTEDNKNSK